MSEVYPAELRAFEAGKEQIVGECSDKAVIFDLLLAVDRQRHQIAALAERGQLAKWSVALKPFIGGSVATRLEEEPEGAGHDRALIELVAERLNCVEGSILQRIDKLSEERFEALKALDAEGAYHQATKDVLTQTEAELEAAISDYQTTLNDLKETIQGSRELAGKCSRLEVEIREKDGQIARLKEQKVPHPATATPKDQDEVEEFVSRLPTAATGGAKAPLPPVAAVPPLPLWQTQEIKELATELRLGLMAWKAGYTVDQAMAAITSMAEGVTMFKAGAAAGLTENQTAGLQNNYRDQIEYAASAQGEARAKYVAKLRRVMEAREARAQVSP